MDQMEGGGATDQKIYTATDVAVLDDGNVIHHTDRDLPIRHQDLELKPLIWCTPSSWEYSGKEKDDSATRNGIYVQGIYVHVFQG